MAKQSKLIMFGTPAGVSEGDWFADHAELYAKDLHRFRGRGISGTEKTGVDSIVLSGGYVDDVDKGTEIIYTGEGGRDRDTGRLIADQSLADPGNAGLVVSRAMGYPVRVIEGLGIKGKKRRRATEGYRYRGLYRVADHWLTIGQDGFEVCRFRLLKIEPGEVVRPQAVDPASGEDTDFERQVRRYIAQDRLVRDSAVVRKVKEMYDNRCQICKERLIVSAAGDAYSEAAHIQALGKPHYGPDEIENVLCLCPNCHTRFDRGVYQVTDSFEVIDRLTQRFVTELARTKAHRIGVEFLRWHRKRWENPTS
jgi:putative restriction endonuclease